MALQNASDFIKVKRKNEELIVEFTEKGRRAPYIKIVGNVFDVKTWVKIFKIAQEITGINLIMRIREEMAKEGLFW